MPPQWVQKPLSEFIVLQRGFDLPHHKRVPGRFRVLSSGAASGSHNEGPVKGPGFVVGRATNIGRPTWSDDDYWPLNTVLYAKDFLGNDPRFAYYWFLSTDLTAYNSGSVQPMLNRNYIANVPISIPPLIEQRGIAATLAALDRKIESNRRQQELAESLLRAVVEQALRSLDDRTTTLAAYCTLVKDGVATKDIDADSLYIGFDNMPRGKIFLDDWGTAQGLGSNKSQFRAGDVLFGKLRPYFKKVGIAPVDGICSTDILVLRPTHVEDTALVALVASSDELIDKLSASATGTRMPRASWGDLANWPVPELAEGQRKELGSTAQPLIERMTLLTHETKRLVALRDTLLPELLSGRIRVPEASKALEEVVA